MVPMLRRSTIAGVIAVSSFAGCAVGPNSFAGPTHGDPIHPRPTTWGDLGAPWRGAAQTIGR